LAREWLLETTVRHFDELLEQLRRKLLEMSALVESSILDSIKSLTERNSSEAEAVFKRESEINQLEIHIDDIATSLLALEQPVANDLRFITAAAKINSNLERIGDLAVNIAERSESLIRHPQFPVRADIPRLADLATSMVQQSLDAFVKKDTDVARGVLLSDDAVDDLRDSIYNELIGYMKKNPQAVQPCVDLMFAARSLERIADHATNIAEGVIFMIDGVDVRHHAQAGR
jgi:phosphate transport system protein